MHGAIYFLIAMYYINNYGGFDWFKFFFFFFGSCLDAVNYDIFIGMYMLSFNLSSAKINPIETCFAVLFLINYVTTGKIFLTEVRGNNQQVQERQHVVHHIYNHYIVPNYSGIRQY